MSDQSPSTGTAARHTNRLCGLDAETWTGCDYDWCECVCHREVSHAE